MCTITISSSHRAVTTNRWLSDDVKEGVSMVFGLVSICYLIMAPLCESGVVWRL